MTHEGKVTAPERPTEAIAPMSNDELASMRNVIEGAGLDFMMVGFAVQDNPQQGKQLTGIAAQRLLRYAHSLESQLNVLGTLIDDIEHYADRSWTVRNLISAYRSQSQEKTT